MFVFIPGSIPAAGEIWASRTDLCDGSILPLTYTPSHSRSQTHTLSLSLSLYIYIFTHTNSISQKQSLSLFLSLSFSETISLSLSYKHSLCLCEVPASSVILARVRVSILCCTIFAQIREILKNFVSCNCDFFYLKI